MVAPSDLYEFDTPYVKVLADPLTQCLSIRWKNYAPSGTYRSMLDTAVDLIRERGLRYFLSDQRRRGAILHADEVWLAMDWVPRMARTGLERAAIVQSADVFNSVAIDRVVGTVQPGIVFPIRLFNTPEEAEAWLYSPADVTS
ncbi:MAG: hypothetical protein IPI81_14330 [Flavobacteriales bacterium]|nr:hypothetical protein [Flavobacteriales bacterium]MCC6937888.1 hypothetical protein [Flavobacteriales bacterium]